MTAQTQDSVKVSAIDRLGFTLFVAIALHAVIILGISFAPEKPPAISHTLEITLAQYQSDKAPEKADFIAQHDQQGSGESEQKVQPTTRERALFQANESNQVAPQQQPMVVQRIDQQTAPSPTLETVEKQVDPRPEKRSVKRQEVLVTQAETAKKVQVEAERDKQQAAPPSTGAATSLLARSLEIASLQAKIAMDMEINANRPKVRRLNSASTRQSFDAAYLNAWRDKVERIGNLNYPEEARRRKLYGSLILLVVIRPDGGLERIEISKSSGHKVLDDAAVRIVRLAAPFSPFPPELRKHADQVEIIRTWRFERARLGVNS